MKTSTTTRMNAPASTIFLWLEDKDRLKQWVPNLAEDTPILETPDKVGSTFKQVFVENGRKMEMTGEITAYEKDTRLRVFMTGASFNLDVDYILTPLPASQTEVTQHTHITLKGATKFFTPLFRVALKFSKKDPQAEAHNRLKVLVEAWGDLEGGGV